MQAPRDFLGEKIWKRADSVPMAQTDPESPEAIAYRLACLQEAKMPGQTQTAFAVAMGLDVKRWNNYLRGYSLPREAAEILIKKIPGVTYNWLWHGAMDGVPMVLQAELEAAGKRITSAAKGRSKDRSRAG